MDATWHSVPYTTASAYPLWWDNEAPPTLGVREPREPSPSNLTGGAAAELHFDAEPEAEAVAQGARIEAL